MDYRITEGDAGVFIEINDEKEGWLPLFGANNRGDFVGMPTCILYCALSRHPAIPSIRIIPFPADSNRYNQYIMF